MTSPMSLMTVMQLFMLLSLIAPVYSKKNLYLRNIDATEEWLLAEATGPNGALLFTPTLISPRYGNVAALGLLLDPFQSSAHASALHQVERWMTWYLAHLNWPDQWGVYGTIYDFHLSEEKLMNAGSSLFVPSNGATFLSLALAMWNHQGSHQWRNRRTREFILKVAGKDHGHLYDAIGSAVVQMSVEKRELLTNYDQGPFLLSSACEVYRGLSDLSEFFEIAFNNSAKAAYFRNAANSMLKFIHAEYWRDDLGLYLPYVGADAVDMRKWYPDATSQLYPIVYGVISHNSSEAAELWSKFEGAWPGWRSYSHTSQDPSPWEIVTYAAALAGRVQEAEERLSIATIKFAEQGFPWPWSCEEAGWYLHTNAFMHRLKQQQQQREE